MGEANETDLTWPEWMGLRIVGAADEPQAFVDGLILDNVPSLEKGDGSRFEGYRFRAWRIRVLELYDLIGFELRDHF